MWGVQVHGNPRYLLRAICTREEGVQAHRLSGGDAQHRSWESRQTQAAGWREGFWEETSYLSSVPLSRDLLWGPILPPYNTVI